MADDAKRRREQRLRFAQTRIAERGDYTDQDRGDYTDQDRGDYTDQDRGGLGLGAGTAQSQAAADILRRAVGLGGHLVVAFVSPVGAAPVSRRRFRRSRPSDLTTAGARARVTERIKAKTPAGEKPATPGQTGAGSSSHPAGQVPPKSTGY